MAHLSGESLTQAVAVAVQERLRHLAEQEAHAVDQRREVVERMIEDLGPRWPDLLLIGRNTGMSAANYLETAIVVDMAGDPL